MDKQIIIDGVDVSGCPYYIDSEGGCSSHDCECIKCVHNVCFYKDYKVKEQECEELKKDNNCFQDRVVKLKLAVLSMTDDIDQLKAENDKYSLFIEKLCDYAGLECDNEEQAMRTLLNLASQMNKARWIIDKYKQTLAEIKEIAETAAKCMYATYSDDYTEGYSWLGRIILQKISDCEGNNEHS